MSISLNFHLSTVTHEELLNFIRTAWELIDNGKPNIPDFRFNSTMAIYYKNVWLCINAKGQLA